MKVPHHKGFNKREKRFWRDWHSIPSPNQIPSHIHRLAYNTENIGDEELGYIASRVKSIDQLDLNETDITNKGISYLTRLDSLKELRLKDTYIDDDCVSDLLKINGLEFLHLKHTDLTIEGIMKLGELKTLKTLLVTVPQDETDKLKTLQQRLPNCELVVNGTNF